MLEKCRDKIGTEQVGPSVSHYKRMPGLSFVNGSMTISFFVFFSKWQMNNIVHRFHNKKIYMLKINLKMTSLVLDLVIA